MNQFVESLKRLYAKQMVDTEKIVSLENKGTITKEEREYIMSL